MSQVKGEGQNQKLQITLSVITDILIKPQQFPVSSFELHSTACRCCDLDLGPMTLKLNRDLDILRMSPN